MVGTTISIGTNLSGLYVNYFSKIKFVQALMQTVSVILLIYQQYLNLTMQNMFQTDENENIENAQRFKLLS